MIPLFLFSFIILLIINIFHPLLAADKAMNCPAMGLDLCKNEYYKAYMSEYCADFCASSASQSSTSTQQCGDKPGYTFRCIAWKGNGFCEGFNGFWTQEQVKEFCGKTCQKC